MLADVKEPQTNKEGEMCQMLSVLKVIQSSNSIYTPKALYLYSVLCLKICIFFVVAVILETFFSEKEAET